MIELERHIEILLLNNDCVIVPDLGGFMAHHVNARYDETDALFLPPLRTLGFNPQLTMNDSLLVQSYIEAYDISYPEALRRIEKEVAELRQHLESEGEYELNDIGVLRMNDDGRMEFEPCEAGILTPSLYGLSSFEMIPVATKTWPQETEQKSVAEKKTDNAELQPGMTDDCETTSITEELSTEKAKEATEPAIVIKMSWLRNAAAIAAAIIAFFMIQTPVSNSQLMSEVQQSSVLPIASSHVVKAEVEEPKTIIAEEALRPTEQVSETELIAVSHPVEQVSQTKAAGYCIVLASQTTRQLAEEFITQLKKKGHPDARMMDMRNTNKVRVIYGDYSSESDAYNQLRQMHKQKEFKEAWVLRL